MSIKSTYDEGLEKIHEMQADFCDTPFRKAFIPLLFFNN